MLPHSLDLCSSRQEIVWGGMKRFPLRRLYRSTLSIPFLSRPFLSTFPFSPFLSGAGACSMLVVRRRRRGTVFTFTTVRATLGLRLNIIRLFCGAILAVIYRIVMDV